LAWNPDAAIGLAGYKIYYGVSSRTGSDPKSCGLCGYSTVVPIGNVTTYTVNNLTDGQTYYVSVTAYDSSSNESGFSNEVNGAATSPTQTYAYTLATDPTGLQVMVDGTMYNTPQTFTWVSASSHTLSVLSPQSGSAGTQYGFASWSDGGGQSHTIMAPSSATTYTASFNTQYSLTTSTNPPAGGAVNPPGLNWYASGQGVSISATANTGYGFSGWTGDLSGSTNPASLTMNGPKSITANFTHSGSLVVTPSAGLNISGKQGGTFSPSRQTYMLQNKGQVPVKWNVSKKAGWVALSLTGGSLTPGGTAQVTVSITNAAKQLKAGSYSDTIVFSDASQKNDNLSLSINLTVNPPVKTYSVKTHPEGLQVVVDGITYTSLSTFDWEVGSSHTLEAPSPQSSSSGAQYVFISWSNRKPQNQTLLAPSSGATYVATFRTPRVPSAAVNSTKEGTAGGNAHGLMNSSE